MCDYASYRTPEGREEVEPEPDGPLKKWKMYSSKKRKEMQFLEDVVR